MFSLLTYVARFVGSQQSVVQCASTILNDTMVSPNIVDTFPEILAASSLVIGSASRRICKGGSNPDEELLLILNDIAEQLTLDTALISSAVNWMLDYCVY